MGQLIRLSETRRDMRGKVDEYWRPIIIWW